jgi:putative thioredoxin
MATWNGACLEKPAAPPLNVNVHIRLPLAGIFMTTPATDTLTVTTDTFMKDVVEASAGTPVLVDFWAPWCGPCKQLMPTLDAVASSYAGRVKLAKVNTDEEGDLAQHVGIRSLPTVVLFKDGNAVDHFSGVVPEAQIRAMLDKHLEEPAKASDITQSLVAAGDYTAARAEVEARLKLDTENVELRAQLAELLALDGELDQAREQLGNLQAREPAHRAVRKLGALLEFIGLAAANSDVLAFKERVANDPNDLEALHTLAVHRLLGGDVEPALQTWLTMMRDHRSYGDDLARRSLVHAFEVIGEADPIVGQTRRAMARMLF